MRLHKTALYLFPSWNLMSPSCFSNPITYDTREFRRFSSV